MHKILIYLNSVQPKLVRNMLGSIDLVFQTVKFF